MQRWLNKSYLEVFPFEGYNPTHNTVHGNPVPVALIDGSEDTSYVKHKSSLFVQITSFFNLPNRMRIDSGPSFFSILKNAFFWPQDIDASLTRKIVGVIFGVLILPLRLLSVITGTLIHAVMLLTELLPLALQNLCKEKLGNDSALADVFGIIHFIGRAITSPISGMRMEFAKPGLKGYVLPLISAAITIVSYSLLAPLVALAAANYAIIHAPALLTQIMASPFLNTFIPICTPYLLPIAQTIASLFNIGLGQAFFATTVGAVGAWIGVNATISVNAFNKFINDIFNTIYRTADSTTDAAQQQNNARTTTATLIELTNEAGPGSYGKQWHGDSLFATPSEPQAMPKGAADWVMTLGTFTAPQPGSEQTAEEIAKPAIGFGNDYS